MPLTKTAKPIGTRVLIENTKQDPDRYMRDGICLPENAIETTKLVKGVVIAMGPEAASEGLQIGDTVLYDKNSIFAQGINWTGTEKEGDLIITNVENVICVFVEEKEN